MSAMPFYFSIAALTVLLIYREIHHSQIEKGLINKILEQHGLDAIPSEHPLAEAVSSLVRKSDDDNSKLPERVRIPIPGMMAFEHMRKRLAAKK